jgi:hypothetical protein
MGITKLYKKLSVALSAGVFLFACSETTKTTSTEVPNEIVAIELEGTAASGYALAGVHWELYDQNEHLLDSGTTDSNGTFYTSIEVADSLSRQALWIEVSGDNFNYACLSLADSTRDNHLLRYPVISPVSNYLLRHRLQLQHPGELGSFNPQLWREEELELRQAMGLNYPIPLDDPDYIAARPHIWNSTPSDGDIFLHALGELSLRDSMTMEAWIDQQLNSGILLTEDREFLLEWALLQEEFQVNIENDFFVDNMILSTADQGISSWEQGLNMVDSIPFIRELVALHGSNSALANEVRSLFLLLLESSAIALEEARIVTGTDYLPLLPAIHQVLVMEAEGQLREQNLLNWQYSAWEVARLYMHELGLYITHILLEFPAEEWEINSQELLLLTRSLVHEYIINTTPLNSFLTAPGTFPEPPEADVIDAEIYEMQSTEEEFYLEPINAPQGPEDCPEGTIGNIDAAGNIICEPDQVVGLPACEEEWANGEECDPALQ